MDVQTTTPWALLPLPSKDALVAEFGGKPLSSVRTPAAIIDVAKFRRNAQAMKDRCESVRALFRAHVKSHKTAEGTRLQLQTTPPTTAVVVSTLAEAWGLVTSRLTEDGTVTDILYGFPLPVDKIADLLDLQTHVERVTVMIDSELQVRALAKFAAARTDRKPICFHAFIKIDQGGARAGVKPDSPLLKPLIIAVLQSPHLVLHGFYSHAGNAYGARDGVTAADFLRLEIVAVQTGAELAHAVAAELGLPSLKLVMSVGSTPTASASRHLADGALPAAQRAHAALPPTMRAVVDARAQAEPGRLGVRGGRLEIHAGVYPLLDLQQRATGLHTDADAALSILARVCSVYAHREPPQVLIDAGALAFSKDTGPSGGYGEVHKGLLVGWRVSKVSQEHGLLDPPADMADNHARVLLKEWAEELLGTMLHVRPQHACLTCAGHPWYYIVDSDEAEGTEILVRDLWVPWKGW